MHFDGLLKLVVEGFDVAVGPHSQRQFNGYYVSIHSPDEEKCEECGGYANDAWSDAGHGWTIDEAIDNAIKRFDGVEYRHYESEDFEKRKEQ